MQFRANRRQAHLSHVKHFFSRFCALAKKLFGRSKESPTWGGRALISACSDIRFLNVRQSMAELWALRFYLKERHLVVFQVCDLNVTHRIYNFSPGLTTLPNKIDFSYTLSMCKSPAKSLR